MEIRELELPGVFELTPRIYHDERGHFFETYNKKTFEKLGIKTKFVQDNQSFSKKGVVRGLHFQAPPFAQAKLVRVISGRVLDVVVDCRRNSPTYGKHIALELSMSLNNILYIPDGFAHGFSAIEDSVFQYKCSQVYNKKSEMGIHPMDELLKIEWMLEEKIFSEKDLELPRFIDFSTPFLTI
jgi:dTDP-4-dehydrorhamnose 3,5-epimerase